MSGEALLDALTRQGGLTARYLAGGVTGLASAFANPLAWAMNKGLEAGGADYRFPEQYEALQRAMTDAGLPEPQGGLEKGIGFASEMGIPDPTDVGHAAAQLSHLIDPQMAMTLFHGSPHKWDKVDLSKVGTGEGAQAYGHGFYAAENPKVAEQYQKDLSGYRIEVGGKPIDSRDPSGRAIEAYRGNGHDVSRAIERLRLDADNTEKFLRESGQWEYPSATKEFIQRDRDAAILLEKQGLPEYQQVPTGNLYELDLPDETAAKMLDWDAPLSEQPESVRKSINDYVGYDYAAEAPKAKGQDVYAVMSMKAGGDDKASEVLNSLGIPGIKYLDGTSRNAGEGTRNFVVFDENAITPLKRNGELLGAMNGKSLADQYPGRNFLEPDRTWYHGTRAEVGDDFAFDPEKIGSATDDGWLGKGFYFSPHEDVSKAYGKNTVQANLKLKNPFVFPDDVNPVAFVKEKGGPEAFTDWAKAQGYDGAISDSVLHQAVVFDTGSDAINIVKRNGEALGNTFSKSYTPAPEGSLDETGRAIEKNLYDRINSDVEGAVAEYNKLPSTKGGKIIAADDARELSPEYVKDRSLSAAVHEPASALSKELWARKLAEPSDKPVLLMSGGTGAGKSTGLKLIGDDYHAIFDSNLADFGKATKKIDEALNKGFDVDIMHVWRDPVESFSGEGGSALTRAMKGGNGRTVPVGSHVSTHTGSNATIKQIAEKYADDPRVNVHIVDNSRGKGMARESDLSVIQDIDSTALERNVLDELEKAREAGRISETVYRGFLGSAE